jgi:PKD repeat protein
VSGSFFVDINVTVLVTAFGFEQTVNESFSLPLTIDPSAGGGDPTSFELSSTLGCAPLTVSATNTIVDAGASYAWNFGNGQTSTALNPSFTYDAPGTYTVSLLTEVTELSLTQVNITALGSGWGGDIEDVFGQPDPYFVLSGPQGGIYTSGYVDGNQTPSFGGFNIPLESGTTYNIAFYDSDGVFTADDFLGSSDFTPTSGGDITVSNSTTAILSIAENVAASFNESIQVLVFDSLDVFEDLDGDGFGNPNVPIDGCNPENTAPFAFNDQDCDDSNALIYFGAEGTGENIDNNCDGLIEGAELTTVLGCTDGAACNFDPAATVDDGSCVIPETGFDCEGNCVAGIDCNGICGGGAVEDGCGICGGDGSTCSGCTDESASNYDPSATIDDGSCEFPLCIGDLTGDFLVSVSDILQILGDYGCLVNCASDVTLDDAVSVDDLLTVLSNFGQVCPQ